MMRWVRGGRGALLVGLGTVMTSIGAQAQSAPASQRVELAPAQPSANGAVFVQLHAGERAFSVTPAGGSRHAPNPVIANCEGECGFWAWPGSYKLHFPNSGEQKATNTILRIRDPGDYTLEPGNVGARNTGLTLGIIGPVVTLAGAIMLVAGAYQTVCDPEPESSCDRATPPLAYYGLGTLLAGIGITTVGWVMYAKNGVRFAYAPAAAAATAPSMTARVGLMPLPRGGFGLGAAVEF